MKKHWKDYALLLSVAGAIVAVDQWTKILVRNSLGFQETWVPWEWLSPFARIVHWQNTGAAFGMFQNMNPVFMVLATIVSLVILLFLWHIPSAVVPILTIPISVLLTFIPHFLLNLVPLFWTQYTILPYLIR